LERIRSQKRIGFEIIFCDRHHGYFKTWRYNGPHRIDLYRNLNMSVSTDTANMIERGFKLAVIRRANELEAVHADMEYSQIEKRIKALTDAQATLFSYQEERAATKK